MLNSRQIILATLAFFAAQGEARPTELVGLFDDLDEAIGDDWINAWTTLPSEACYRKLAQASKLNEELVQYDGSVNENKMRIMNCWIYFSASGHDY